jgi:glutamate--cysteine ligase
MLDIHATTGPLHFLEKLFIAHSKLIEQWFLAQWEQTFAPVYGSVDLRNAGFKIAPIDMNLFPAGFNNLNSDYLSLSVEAAKKAIETITPNAKQILVIPESHTRNLYYWENIKTLQTILEKAGFVVRLGLLDDKVLTATVIELASGDKVTVEPLIRKNEVLQLDGFIPDMILLNNDLSEGIPDILHNLQQPLIPPAELGWSQRLKSGHFQYYAEVTAEFADTLKLDSWLVAPLFRHCGHIDFMQQEGIDCLILNAEILFAAIQKKYTEYQIPHQPFLIVKADAGTYGMAVMTVRNIDELRALNRKQRTRMSTIKGGQPVQHVIIQEGVYTFETFGPEQAVAEPVVYLWGSCVVGGFYRVHKGRGVDENLNTPGMQFEPLPFPQSCHEPGENLFYIYGVIARLSMLAAAREVKDQLKQ